MSPVLGLLLCHTCILCICSCICINICICNSGPCRGWTLVHRVSSLCLRFLISFLYHLCFMIWVLHVRLCSLTTVEYSQNVQSPHLQIYLHFLQILYSTLFFWRSDYSMLCIKKTNSLPMPSDLTPETKGSGSMCWLNEKELYFLDPLLVSHCRQGAGHWGAGPVWAAPCHVLYSHTFRSSSLSSPPSSFFIILT